MMAHEESQLKVSTEVRDTGESDNVTFTCFHRETRKALVSGIVKPQEPRIAMNWESGFVAWGRAGAYFRGYENLSDAG